MAEESSCALCSTAVADGESHRTINTPEGISPAHRECLLRSVLGGIGHLTAHEYWCLQQHDPDMGMNYRESALAVDQWVHEHGYPGGPDVG